MASVISSRNGEPGPGTRWRGQSSGPWSPAGPSPRCSLPSAAALLPPLQHPQHLPCPPSNLTTARHLPCNHPWAKPPLVTFVTVPLSLCPPLTLSPPGSSQHSSQRDSFRNTARDHASLVLKTLQQLCLQLEKKIFKCSTRFCVHWSHHLGLP